MITIRLQRRGRKNDPSFRVVVLDSKKKVKTGNYLEMVGSYDPRVNRVELKGERIVAWMKEGATVSDTVHNLLVSNKVIDAKKINVLPKKTYTKPAEPVAEAAKAPVAQINTETETPAEELASEEAALVEEKAPESEPEVKTESPAEVEAPTKAEAVESSVAGEAATS